MVEGWGNVCARADRRRDRRSTKELLCWLCCCVWDGKGREISTRRWRQGVDRVGHACPPYGVCGLLESSVSREMSGCLPFLSLTCSPMASMMPVLWIVIRPSLCPLCSSVMCVSALYSLLVPGSNFSFSPMHPHTTQAGGSQEATRGAGQSTHHHLPQPSRRERARVGKRRSSTRKGHSHGGSQEGR